MLNKQIINLIQSDYSKGVVSDDSRLTSRKIYTKMLTVRNRLLVQELNKKKKLSVWNYQTLPCVELIEVDIHECPCAPPSGCTILRSKHKIPKINSSLYGYAINAVTTINRKEIFSIDPTAVDTLEGNKYTRNALRYFIQDGYLYVIAPFALKMVVVSGLFEDPIEAAKFKNFCKATECENCGECIDYLNLEFPLDGDLVEPLVQLVTQDLLAKYLSITSDNRNDNQDERVDPNGKQS